MRLYLATNHYMTNNLAKLYPGRIGYCLQPQTWTNKVEGMPYFIDNGAYSDFRQGRAFRKNAFLNLLHKANDCKRKPEFVVVPDRFGDASTTRCLWDVWSQNIRSINADFKLAYVVQPTSDGGFPDISTIPSDADLIFTGGDKPWKFQAVLAYKASGLSIHVGGISASRLYWCHLQGASSGDSSGFFRGDMNQLQRLYDYLADSQGELNGLRAPSFLRQNKCHSNGQLSLFG